MKQNIYPYITEEIKRLLKQRIISYKELAEHLNVSEKTIIRSINNQQEFSLERLTSICSLLKVSLTDLFLIAEKSMEKVYFFTDKQDEVMSNEPDLYALLNQLYEEQNIEKLATRNNLSSSEVYLMLRKLEEINIISIGTNNRINIKTPKHTAFHPNSRYASKIYKKTIDNMSHVCCDPRNNKDSATKFINVSLTESEYASFLDNIRSYFVEMLREQHKKTNNRKTNYTIALMIGKGNYLPDFSELGSLDRD